MTDPTWQFDLTALFYESDFDSAAFDDPAPSGSFGAFSLIDVNNQAGTAKVRANKDALTAGKYKVAVKATGTWTGSKKDPNCSTCPNAATAITTPPQTSSSWWKSAARSRPSLLIKTRSRSAHRSRSQRPARKMPAWKKSNGPTAATPAPKPAPPSPPLFQKPAKKPSKPNAPQVNQRQRPSP